MTAPDNTTDAVWSAIDREKRRDSILRRTCFGAWTVTIALLLVYGGLVASRVSHLRQLAMLGTATRQEVFDATIPLIAVVGTVALLIAALTTIGVFLRMRTATLSEIQLRLAALETMLSSRPDSTS